MDTGLFNLTVACVLKSGGHYDAEYVERLRDGVRNNLIIPYRFVCLSDVDVPCERIELKYDLPGWWSKMELFRPDIPEDILYFDLDTVIVGDLTPLTDMTVPRMLRGGVSSIMALPNHCRGGVWESWIKNPEKIMAKFGDEESRNDLAKRCALGFDKTNIGDQAFIRGELKYDIFPDRLFCTYEDIAETVSEVSGPTIISKPRAMRRPKNVAAVIFNYSPRPRDVNWLDGYRAA